MPTFTGPYSEELTEAWQKSKSAWVHAVLEDSQISEQEYKELGVRLGECFAESGVEFTGLSDDGVGYSLGPSSMNSDDLERVADSCDESTGQRWIQVLRASMMSNPQNTPIEEVMTECLIRNGAVAPDYTAEQYLRDVPKQAFPFLDSSKEQVFWACSTSPSYTAANQ
ncbi:hypothetical protein DY023_06290 [Microbacterium bovistercoris]|uniref:Uncharacterized protein n=1 Tax=Microbacterium bovistercoris TaxID=2293570 RepID=A0A371NWC1_9MICO|nr:hypothetical protein [Microbacterium bovistercoris]REJ06385.1 hypothetical protein DY023_06290 [Microbacterium bovistercoris]